MPYAQIAAVALPYVLGAMQKSPQAPQYAPPPTVNPPDRSMYSNALMSAAFNPNNEMYQGAAQVAQQQVARMLGRRGLAGSSIGGALMGNVQSQLANDYLMNQVQRQSQALGQINAMDMARAQHEANMYNQAYQAQMGDYQNQMARRQQAMAGIGGLAQAGLGIYQNHQNNQLMDQRRAQDAAMIQGLFTQPAPQMGVPGAPPGVMPTLQAPSGPLFGGGY